MVVAAPRPPAVRPWMGHFFQALRPAAPTGRLGSPSVYSLPYTRVSGQTRGLTFRRGLPPAPHPRSPHEDQGPAHQAQLTCVRKRCFSSRAPLSRGRRTPTRTDGGGHLCCALEQPELGKDAGPCARCSCPTPPPPAECPARHGRGEAWAQPPGQRRCFTSTGSLLHFVLGWRQRSQR